jgi:hypothetical protein
MGGENDSRWLVVLLGIVLSSFTSAAQRHKAGSGNSHIEFTQQDAVKHLI